MGPASKELDEGRQEEGVEAGLRYSGLYGWQGHLPVGMEEYCQYRGTVVILIFVQMQLQTAPVLVFFPPTTGPHATGKAMERLDFNTG